MWKSLSTWDVFWMNWIQMVASGRKAADAIISLIYTRGLQLECVRVVHKALLLLAILYGNEAMV